MEALASVDYVIINAQKSKKERKVGEKMARENELREGIYWISDRSLVIKW